MRRLGLGAGAGAAGDIAGLGICWPDFGGEVLGFFGEEFEDGIKRGLRDGANLEVSAEHDGGLMGGSRGGRSLAEARSS